jgi:hypothetical protein
MDSHRLGVCIGAMKRAFQKLLQTWKNVVLCKLSLRVCANVWGFFHRRYNLKLTKFDVSFKAGLQSAVDNMGLKAVFMGQRLTDPYCGERVECVQPLTSMSDKLSTMSPTDKGWPQLMRINPILHWTYEDVWLFTRHERIPVRNIGCSYCLQTFTCATLHRFAHCIVADSLRLARQTARQPTRTCDVAQLRRRTMLTLMRQVRLITLTITC